MTRTGIMYHLKRSKDPPVLKGLNQYIKFSTKFVLAQASIDFLCDCIDKNIYPRNYWRILRRNRVRISQSSLRRHALNEKDTVQHQLDALTFNVTQSKATLDLLTNEERNEFE